MSNSNFCFIEDETGHFWTGSRIFTPTDLSISNCLGFVENEWCGNSCLGLGLSIVFVISTVFTKSYQVHLYVELLLSCKFRGVFVFVLDAGQPMVRSAGDTDTTLPPIIVYQLPSPLSSSRYFELVFYKNGLTESNPSSLHFALAWQPIQSIMKTWVLLGFFLVFSVLSVRGGVRWRRSLFDIIPGVGSGIDSGK